MQLNFSVVAPYTEMIAIGAAWTMLIFVFASVLSLFAGVVFSLLSLYAPAIVRRPVQFFMWVFMGTPLLLQLFVIYYGLAPLGIRLPAIWSGIIGLGLHFAVYNADIFRIAIQTIDGGQQEAARSLGFSNAQAIRLFLVPQAIVKSLPQAGNNLIALLKDTAIVSVVGVTELVYASQQAISQTYRPFEFYITVAAIYYGLNLVLEVGLRHFEKRVEAYR